MVANKLKNLISLSREALRDARQVLDEIANSLGSGRVPQAQPALARIPVRSNPARNLRSPFNNNNGYRFNNYRSFSTASVVKNSSTFSNFLFKQQNASRFTYSKRIPKNFASQIWSYSAFRRPLSGSGAFPNGLYRNFVGLNARNFSTYGANFSREAVQNLTTSLRCFLNNGSDLGAKLMKSKSQDVQQHNLSYDGCASQNQAQQTFKLAKCESTGIERLGSYVEFTLPSLELSIPSISFINDEILNTMESNFERIKEQMDRTNSNIQLIFDSYGSLPLERRRDSVRIHFPNLDSFELEKLLVELNIHEGFVYTNDDVIELINREIDVLSETDSSFSLGDYLDAEMPDLISTDEDSSSDVTRSTEDQLYFLPATSNESPDERSIGDPNSPVFIHNFSDNYQVNAVL